MLIHHGRLEHEEASGVQTHKGPCMLTDTHIQLVFVLPVMKLIILVHLP